ncbi:putative ribonuclease H-like domain-containing protein [Tanacetum coccineum]
MQEELLQFKLQEVWTLVDLPNRKRAIGTKWVFKNKKDERGIVIKNKARLMDVKSAFLYGKIEDEVYVCQPLGFEDPDFPDRRGKIDKTLFIRRDKGDILLVQVYVDDIIFGSTKKSLCTEFEKMMHKKFQMSSMGELTFFLGLQVKQKNDEIFISQDKYMTEILKKFGFTDVKTANTPMETQKPLLKDEDGEEVDVHLYRSMIGSLMYLTSLRPDIMYLKGQPKLGLWYPKDSTFDLVAYTDSDYAEASLDRKSTTGGCQFLRCRLISWQCKKQTVVANSTTEVEYVTASSCCGQVLWVQNQLLDYGYNFMHTKIYRKSTTGGYQFLRCRLISWQYKKQTVVANSTIEAEYVAALSCYGQVLWIQNQLLDYGVSNEKKLIQIIKIYTNKNVADLLTKAFDSGIRVNAGDSKLMLLGINLLLLGKVNAVRHKLTAAGYALSVNTTIYTSCIEKFWATVKVKTVNEEQQLQALVDRKKIVITEAFVRRDLQLDDEEGTDCLPNVTIFEELTRMGSRRNGPKEKDTQVPKSSVPSDPTNVADEDSMQLKELMDFCTKLQQRVLDLENTKTAQAQEITSLRKRFKKLEKKGGSRTHKLKRLYKVGRSARIVSADKASLGDQEDASKHGRKIDDIDVDIDITLVNDAMNDQDMFDVNDLVGKEVFVAKQGVPDSKKDDVAQVNTAVTTVSTASTIPVSAAAIIEDEITLSQALAELKSVKPKVTTATTATTKGILLQEPKPANMKKKDQISFDEQEAIRLQAEFDKEERLAREKDKANRVNIVSGKNVNAARPKAVVNTAKPEVVVNACNPQQDLQDQGVIDSGCSRHMTVNMSYLTDFEEIDGGYVAFGDYLGKFDGKADEGFFVGYSINSKTFRVFNSRTRIVEENLHVKFSENTPNIAGSRPNWLFDIDALTKSIISLMVMQTADPPFSQDSKSSPDAGFKPSGDDEKKAAEEPGKEDGDPSKEGESNDLEKEDNVNSTNTINAASTNEVNVVAAKTSIELPDEPNIPELEDIVYLDDNEDVLTASTPIEAQKLLLKDEDDKEVDVHLYRSMIGSLMYLTSSRPDIKFVVLQEQELHQADHWNKMCYQLLKLITKQLKNPGSV